MSEDLDKLRERFFSFRDSYLREKPLANSADAHVAFLEHDLEFITLRGALRLIQATTLCARSKEIAEQALANPTNEQEIK